MHYSIGMSRDVWYEKKCYWMAKFMFIFTLSLRSLHVLAVHINVEHWYLLDHQLNNVVYIKLLPVNYFDLSVTKDLNVLITLIYLDCLPWIPLSNLSVGGEFVMSF